MCRRWSWQVSTGLLLFATLGCGEREEGARADASVADAAAAGGADGASDPAALDARADTRAEPDTGTPAHDAMAGEDLGRDASGERDGRADGRPSDTAPADRLTDAPPDLPPSRDAPIADAAPDSAARDSRAEAGCSGWSALQRLSPAEAADLIASANPIVINVHVPYEGDIPGTDVDIPYSDVDAIEAYLAHDRCADVLLVCKSGSMSLSAGNELIKRGYLRIRDLAGGMEAWQKAGYVLLKDGGA